MATDKIEVEKLSVIKGREGRDLDTLVDGDTLISGETSAGVFGVFKFFEGIKAFFKGVTALGTLAKTNKIPVLQDDGSLKFTTPADITSGLASTSDVNNALANLTELLRAAKTDFNECLPTTNKYGIFFLAYDANNRPTSGYNWMVTVYNYSNYQYSQYAQGMSTSNSPCAYIRHYTGTAWTSWQKLTTETDLAKHQFISASTKSNQVKNLSFEVSSIKGSGRMWISNRATTDSAYVQGQFTFQVYSNGTVAYKQYETDIISSVTFNATTKMVTVTFTLTAYFQVQGEFVPSIEN